ncbi:hypothetical protein [Nocardioides terrisoli]|uniref:hypothetical protein n=1 Tax=Nocardioides terrisoli TaxID=3388267 RepID=UPI00287BB034|nr:hypothetical protein [Nocardioides marmorisolisilvae]
MLGPDLPPTTLGLLLRPVTVAVNRDSGDLLCGTGAGGETLLHLWTAPELVMAVPDGFVTRSARAVDVVAELIDGMAVVVDAGTSRAVYFSPANAMRLRRCATALRSGEIGVWRSPPDAVVKAVRAVAQAQAQVERVWLMAASGHGAQPCVFVVYDAATGTLRRATDRAPVDRELAGAIGKVGTPEQLGLAVLEVGALAVQPRMVTVALSGLPPLFERSPTVPDSPAMVDCTADDFAPVLLVEKAGRGNGRAQAWTGDPDGAPSAPYPLDVEAIRAEFDLPGCIVVHTWPDGGNAMWCTRTRVGISGDPGRRGRLERLMLRNWWKRWERKPRERQVFAHRS